MSVCVCARALTVSYDEIRLKYEQKELVTS